MEEVNKQQSKKMVRGLTLTAGIIKILIAIASLVLGIIFLIIFVSQSADDPNAGEVILWVLGLGLIVIGGIFFLVLAVFGVMLGVGIATIKISHQTPYGYSRKKATLITFIVLEFLATIAFVFLTFAFPEVKVVWLILAGVFLLMALLQMLDLIIFKVSVKKGKYEIIEPAKPQVQNINLNNLNTLAPNAQEPQKQDLEAELKKLEDLREKNLITAEEYVEMRKKLLENHVK